MKFFFTISFSLFIFSANAEDNKEYIVTGSDITETKTFELENKSKFSSFTVNGSWTDNFGNYVSAGMYFYTVESGAYRDTKKMLLIK